MAATLKIYNEQGNFPSLEFKGKWAKLRVETKDHEGDVEFEMEDGNSTNQIYVNQENLKRLISFLQKQVIPDAEIEDALQQTILHSKEYAEMSDKRIAEFGGGPENYHDEIMDILTKQYKAK